MLAGPAAAEQRFVVIAYHDVVSESSLRNSPGPFAVSTENLAAHFAWLQHQGYTAVSIDDLLAASRNERPLPDKAVLLTFDDGLKSLYTHVYPLLKIFRYPAVASVVTDWLDNGHEQLPRDAFVSWDEAREMQGSGLVEFASHSANLHRGIVSNPQDNLMPAAASRAFMDDAYESYEEFQTRIATDLERSAESIGSALGATPRIITWPFGKYALSNLDAAARLGMSISMTLEVGGNSSAELSSIGRMLIRDNPGIDDFSAMLVPIQRSPVVRAVQVDLDDIYDGDLQRLTSNLDVLIERVKELQISHVFLQAFADPDADGIADAAFFPNRHLPVRADLFSHVAWQLKTRSDVRVFAQMPLRSFAGESVGPEARRVIREVYQDLAVHADFDGILFHDGAELENRLSEVQLQDQVNFSDELVRVLRENRPELKTARSLYAANAISLVPSLNVFLKSYDHVLLRAPANLVSIVAQFDSGMEQTIFDLQVIDQRSGSAVPTDTLHQQMRSLQAAGVKHLAVDPDDFTAVGPIFEQIRKGMSLADYPFRRR
jgi:biofilm PGA synthesis lipoprotein PgaB